MDAFIGFIGMMGFNFNPRGWGTCAGALLPISTNSTLFSLLGTMYGGDGRTTFALPDLRGRAPQSKGRHPGSMYDWRQGQFGGAEEHTLTALEVGSHTHQATFHATSAPTPCAVAMEASTDAPTLKTPVDGAYLAAKGGRSDQPTIFRSDAGSGLASLGGVSVSGGSCGNGVVTVAAGGGGQAFNILAPRLTILFCIAMVGVYPPRG